MQTCHLEAYIRRRATELFKSSSDIPSNTDTTTVFALVLESVEDTAGARSAGDAHIARDRASIVSKGSGVVRVRDKDPELGGCREAYWHLGMEGLARLAAMISSESGEAGLPLRSWITKERYPGE